MRPTGHEIFHRKIGRASKDLVVRAAARKPDSSLRAEGAANQEISRFRSSDLPVKKSGDSQRRGVAIDTEKFWDASDVATTTLRELLQVRPRGGSPSYSCGLRPSSLVARCSPSSADIKRSTAASFSTRSPSAY